MNTRARAIEDLSTIADRVKAIQAERAAAIAGTACRACEGKVAATFNDHCAACPFRPATPLVPPGLPA